jgi:electron transfer flavoprotein beta subunit
MKILVCVKQVPDVEQIIVAQGVDGEAVLGEFPAFRMNRFDEFAVEEAVRIKESFVSVRIDVLTVGSGSALMVVKRAVGMGADRGVHLQAEDEEASCPTMVAARIARYARKEVYDMILTGSMSEDGMHGQVGSMIAGYLDRPCATNVIYMLISNDRNTVSIEREVEGGVREQLQVMLPAVFSLQPGINRPRYPSLSNMLRGNRQRVETIVADSAEDRIAPIEYVGAVLPPRNREGEVLQGNLQEKAKLFLTIFKKKAFIR